MDSSSPWARACSKKHQAFIGFGLQDRTPQSVMCMPSKRRLPIPWPGKFPARSVEFPHPGWVGYVDVDQDLPYRRPCPSSKIGIIPSVPLCWQMAPSSLTESLSPTPGVGPLLVNRAHNGAHPTSRRGASASLMLTWASGCPKPGRVKKPPRLYSRSRHQQVRWLFAWVGLLRGGE